jgi:hypothetical protein
VTAAIGGSSNALPVNLGATLGLNPATALDAVLGGAVGAALGGSNLGAQLPIRLPSCRVSQRTCRSSRTLRVRALPHAT